MKINQVWAFGLLMIIMTSCQGRTESESMQLYDLSRQQLLSEGQAVERLARVRIVLVGELHDNARHHLAQLQVIQALHRTGHKVAIGLEMFRYDSQKELDLWVTGELDEKQFKPIYLDNWNFDWRLYRPIFEYARQNRIPMTGLNVSRKVTAQVAYHGFTSLSPDQKGSLEGITCNVTPTYRDFVKEAYGAHGHGGMSFERFCEAQLVWDTAMAMHAVDFLTHDPDTIMVILAGSGHARKLGIPTQLEQLNSWPYAVVLPETKGLFDAKHVSTQDADYILRNG